MESILGQLGRKRMQDREFDRPVQILHGRPGASRVVRSTAEAAEYLLYKWPAKGGGKHRAARKACLEVLEGLKEAHAARKAFEAAADEADILVGGPQKNNPIAKLVAKGRR
jgi:hypothetical protein